MTEHTEHIPPSPLRNRNLLEMELDDETVILVDHVYMPEGAARVCPDCGGPGHNAGMVGLILDGACGLLSPEEALLLADRLVRGAHLVLESTEDPPDVEREAARYSTPTHP